MTATIIPFPERRVGRLPGEDEFVRAVRSGSLGRLIGHNTDHELRDFFRNCTAALQRYRDAKATREDQL